MRIIIMMKIIKVRRMRRKKISRNLFILRRQVFLNQGRDRKLNLEKIVLFFFFIFLIR